MDKQALLQETYDNAFDDELEKLAKMPKVKDIISGAKKIKKKVSQGIESRVQGLKDPIDVGKVKIKRFTKSMGPEVKEVTKVLKTGKASSDRTRFARFIQGVLLGPRQAKRLKYRQ